jgi:hypothetical protein
VVGVTATVIGGAVGGAVGAFCGAGSLRPHADKMSTNTAPMVNDAAARAVEPPPEFSAGSFKDTPLSQTTALQGNCHRRLGRADRAGVSPQTGRPRLYQF